VKRVSNGTEKGTLLVIFSHAKAIHICNSHEPTLDQKLQKSMTCQRTEKMKIVANLKEKYMEMKQCQCLTKAIRNLGNVLILKFIALNKISGKLKINRFKIPNYA